MNKSTLYNFFTSLAILMCVSCAHQGSKMAAMQDDLTQEASGEDVDAAKEEKNLTTLDVGKQELVAKNDVQAKKENSSPVSESSSNVNSAVLGTKLDSLDDSKKEEAPVEKKVEENTSMVDDKSAEEAVASMLQMGNEEKSLALEEIKKVDVVPSVAVSPAMVVASEDKVNADLAPAEAVAGDAPSESVPAPGRERELSNDSKLNAEPSIETEPVPAPPQKAPKTQGSQNKTKKNRIETVDYSKGIAKKMEQVAVVNTQKTPEVVAVQVPKVEKKVEPKLASAEIADFMREHFLSVGMLALLTVFLAFRLTRRTVKQDENFPL